MLRFPITMSEVSTYRFGVEEIDLDHHCPGCGELFDEDEWEELGGNYFVRAGGYTDYECPECEHHTISVDI